MAEPQPGFTANEGDPEQLPRGEAAALNENMNVQAPDPIDLTEAPVEASGATETPVEAAPVPEDGADDLLPAEAADYEPIYEAASPDEEFLLSPSTRPDEAQWVGSGPRQALPEAVRRHIGPLQEAAAMPGASPQLVALVQYLLRQA